MHHFKYKDLRDFDSIGPYRGIYMTVRMIWLYCHYAMHMKPLFRFTMNGDIAGTVLATKLNMFCTTIPPLFVISSHHDWTDDFIENCLCDHEALRVSTQSNTNLSMSTFITRDLPERLIPQLAPLWLSRTRECLLHSAVRVILSNELLWDSTTKDDNKREQPNH